MEESNHFVDVNKMVNVGRRKCKRPPEWPSGREDNREGCKASEAGSRRKNPAWQNYTWRAVTSSIWFAGQAFSLRHS